MVLNPSSEDSISHSLDDSTADQQSLHPDALSQESDNFVDIETTLDNEESGGVHFMEPGGDKSEAFTFCKNPFSQWFL